MSKVQTRRSVSLNKSVYERLAAYAKETKKSGSAIAEAGIALVIPAGWSPKPSKIAPIAKTFPPPPPIAGVRSPDPGAGLIAFDDRAVDTVHVETESVRIEYDQ